jgi:hypothetical protein
MGAGAADNGRRTIVHPWTQNRTGAAGAWRGRMAALLPALLLALLPALLAADAAYATGIGDEPPAPGGRAPVTDPRWDAPPPGAAAPSGILDPSNPMNPGFWADARAMGSKWLADNMILGAGVTLLSASAALSGLADVVVGLIFTTPLELTTRPTVTAGGPLGSPQGLARTMAQAATAIIVVVLTFRLVGLLWADQHGAVIDLIVQFIAAMALTWGSWGLCDVMIQFANLLAQNIVRGAFGGGWPLLTVPPVSPSPGVSLVYALAIAVYYLLLAALCFQAFKRIIVINILLVAAPLAGVAILTDGAWNYARVWFFRFVEALLTPILWATALGVVQALLTMLIVRVPPNEVLQASVIALLAAFGYAAVLDAPRITGLAAREALAAARATSWAAWAAAAWAARRGRAA